MQKLLTFFQQNFLAFMPYLMISFNDTLTKDIVNFEQLDPVYFPPHQFEKGSAQKGH